MATLARCHATRFATHRTRWKGGSGRPRQASAVGVVAEVVQGVGEGRRGGVAGVERRHPTTGRLGHPLIALVVAVGDPGGVEEAGRATAASSGGAIEVSNRGSGSCGMIVGSGSLRTTKATSSSM